MLMSMIGFVLIVICCWIGKVGFIGLNWGMGVFGEVEGKWVVMCGCFGCVCWILLIVCVVLCWGWKSWCCWWCCGYVVVIVWLWFDRLFCCVVLVYIMVSVCVLDWVMIVLVFCWLVCWFVLGWFVVWCLLCWWFVGCLVCLVLLRLCLVFVSVCWLSCVVWWRCCFIWLVGCLIGIWIVWWWLICWILLWLVWVVNW